MDVSNLHKTIEKCTPHVSLKSRKELAAICEGQNFKSGTLLFKPNQPEQSEYILLQGVARTFLLNTEGEEITLTFFDDNTVLPPFVTRTVKGKSILYSEALTDCSFVKIDAKAFESLMIANLEIREFGNTVLRQELLHKVNKEIRMASWSARERLEQFRKDFAMLENRIPHPMIASYLGITNVSLSRLRKQA